MTYTRNTILLWTLALYLLFNSGFMQLRLPPIEGGGVPVGELVLLGSLLTVSFFRVVPRLADAMWLWPVMVWWIYGIARALAGVPEYGMWALRDATHVLESLFLVVGFVFAANHRAVDRLFSWLPAVLSLAAVYALGYPFASFLVTLSPTITAGAGYESALFFQYINTGQLLLWGAVYLLLFKRTDASRAPITFVAAAFLMAFSVLLFQARSIYLQVMALAVLFLVFRRPLVARTATLLTVVLVILVLIPLVGVEIQGRVGQDISLDFVAAHFLSIGGVPGEGVEGAALGVAQRLGWWVSLYEQWTLSIGRFLFGLGYGFPLIDFQIVGAAVREPHNSFISIIARLGLIGFVAWVSFHVLLLQAWLRAVRRCRSEGWLGMENRLLFLMAFVLIILVWAIGEDALEKPYNSIPYYFFWGIMLRIGWVLERWGERTEAIRAGNLSRSDDGTVREAFA